MVLLVSQNWLDEVVVLITFLLLTVRTDPVTTWPDVGSGSHRGPPVNRARGSG